MSQLYLLVKNCIFIIEIVVVYYNLYDIHDKFEYSCDVTNKAHPYPLQACLLCLKGPNLSLLTLVVWALNLKIIVQGFKPTLAT